MMQEPHHLNENKWLPSFPQVLTAWFKEIWKVNETMPNSLKPECPFKAPWNTFPAYNITMISKLPLNCQDLTSAVYYVLAGRLYTWRNVYRASYMPLTAQGLASFFATHTCPKTALSISFNSALAMIFHLILPNSCFFSIYDTQILALYATHSFYVAGKM